MLSIVRNGAIARIRDCIAGTEDSFLVDVTVFPGNSGGPIVLRPELTYIEGTANPTESRLIGIVTSYVAYSDVAVSAQTGRTRVVFQENSGLASVHPVDHILETIDTDPRQPEVVPTPASSTETTDTPVLEPQQGRVSLVLRQREPRWLG